MISLEEAIEHTEEKIKELTINNCIECAEDHQQLLEWLKELQRYKLNE